MVYRLLVRRRIEVRVQGIVGFESFVAYITFPEGSVERTVGSRIFDILFHVPSDLLVGNDTVRVTLTDYA